MLGLCQVSLPCWDLENTETPNQASARALLLFGAPEVEGAAIVEGWPFAQVRVLRKLWTLLGISGIPCSINWRMEWQQDQKMVAVAWLMDPSWLRASCRCVSTVLRNAYFTHAKTSSAPLAQMIHCILCSSVFSLSPSLFLARSLSHSRSLFSRA